MAELGSKGFKITSFNEDLGTATAKLFTIINLVIKKMYLLRVLMLLHYCSLKFVEDSDVYCRE